MKYNGVLVASVLGWGIAQILKFLFYWIAHKVVRTERLVGSGGMPSSHSSMVCAALVGTGRAAGVESVAFAIMFIVAAIVMYDAMNVRFAAGQHAQALNRIHKHLEETNAASHAEQKAEKALKEYLGHTPLEVVCGALLGIVIGIVTPV